MTLYCRQVFADKDYSEAEKLFSKSELIILSTKWFENDLEKLDLLIRQLKKENKKILLLNNSLEVNTKIRRGFHILDFFVLNNNRLPSNNELKKLKNKPINSLKIQKKLIRY